MAKKSFNKIPKLIKKLSNIDNKVIRVGIVGNADSEMSMIGGVHEFGVTIKVTKKMRAWFAFQGFPLKATTKEIKIPERSFIRSTFDDKKAVDNVFSGMDRIFDVEIDSSKLPEIIGANMQGKIRDKIGSNIKPSNSDMTRVRKGSSRTLIDSGRLKDAIDYEVV